MAAFIVAYGWAITDENLSLLVARIFSALGLCFSIGWYAANAGSKYWQENWEEHVNALEILSGIPIHSVTKTPKKCWRCPGTPYPYSVTKINQRLSLLSILGWIGLFIYAIQKHKSDSSATDNNFMQCLKTLFEPLINLEFLGGGLSS